MESYRYMRRSRLPKEVLLATAAILAVVVMTAAAGATDIGSRVADFRLNDSAGRVHELSGYAGKVVVLVFWSFKCPVSLAYDDRIGALQEQYGNKGIVVLAVASNANETAAEIERNVSNLKLSFPVLLDQDGAVAELLGASHTPSFFIIDRKGFLRYRGALDNGKRVGDGNRVAHVERAVNDILADRPVAVPETSMSGCGIRRTGS
jgi:peroxiredoxin